MKDPRIIFMTPRWLSGLFECQTKSEGRKSYVPARPVGYSSILFRVRAAWLVFTGRADALIWPTDDERTYDAYEREANEVS